MAAAVVDLADLARRRLVLFEELAGRGVKGVGQHAGPLVSVDVELVAEGLGQREELTKGVPPQVVLFDELLHVLRSRTAGTGLEQSAACDERNDGEHLRRGAELEDREQVRVVVTQHVAGHRDGVLALTDAVDGELSGLHRVHDADVQALGVVVLEVLLDLGLDVEVVGAGLIQPEHCWGLGQASTGDGELNPVADGDVLRLAGTPDVTGCDLVAHEHIAGGVDDLDGSGFRDLEGLVVAAVLFGLLRHETDVGDGAHGPRVEGALGLAVLDDGLVDAGVGGVGDDGQSVLGLVILVPHLAADADHRGHGGVDDDVGGYVEVRDALVRVDHGQVGSVGQALLDSGLDSGGRIGGQGVESGEDGGQSVVGGQSRLGEDVTVFGEDVGEECFDDLAEEDGVGDLHHRGLEVDGEEDAVGLGGGDLVLDEFIEGGGVHLRGINDLAGEDGQGFLEDLGVAGFGAQTDGQGVIGVDDH